MIANQICPRTVVYPGIKQFSEMGQNGCVNKTPNPKPEDEMTLVRSTSPFAQMETTLIALVLLQYLKLRARLG
jgi:hypothetical protein